MDRNLCLKCSHEISKHEIKIVGNYEYQEVACQDNGEEYGICNCNAGFRAVMIKKEFTQMEEGKK